MNRRATAIGVAGTALVVDLALFAVAEDSAGRVIGVVVAVLLGGFLVGELRGERD